METEFKIENSYIYRLFQYRTKFLTVRINIILTIGLQRLLLPEWNLNLTISCGQRDCHKTCIVVADIAIAQYHPIKVTEANMASSNIIGEEEGGTISHGGSGSQSF